MTAAKQQGEDVRVELLPCPFCGGEPFHERADYSSCYVICNDCRARGPVSCDEVDADAEASENGEADPGELAAKRLWNTRAARDADMPVGVEAAYRAGYEQACDDNGDRADPDDLSQEVRLYLAALTRLSADRAGWQPIDDAAKNGKLQWVGRGGDFPFADWLRWDGRRWAFSDGSYMDESYGAPLYHPLPTAPEQTP